MTTLTGMEQTIAAKSSQYPLNRLFLCGMVVKHSDVVELEYGFVLGVIE